MTIISLASTIACVSVFGMSSNERAYVKSAIQKVMKNLFHKNERYCNDNMGYLPELRYIFTSVCFATIHNVVRLCKPYN